MQTLISNEFTIWREGGQRLDVEHELCIDILRSSYNGNFGDESTLCKKHGTNGLTEKDRTTLLLNHLLLKKVENCVDLNCVSNATVDELRFALLLEDDAFVSSNALLQLTKLLIMSIFFLSYLLCIFIYLKINYAIFFYHHYLFLIFLY
jgi:hypothetical protein